MGFSQFFSTISANILSTSTTLQTSFVSGFAQCSRTFLKLWIDNFHYGRSNSVIALRLNLKVSVKSAFDSPYTLDVNVFASDIAHSHVIIASIAKILTALVACTQYEPVSTPSN